MLGLAATAIYSGLTTLTVALWQHTAAATSASLVNYMSAGAVKATIGPAATALVWLVFVLSLVTAAMSLPALFMLATWQRLISDFGELEDVPSGLLIEEWRARTENMPESDHELSTLNSSSSADTGRRR
jgi:hypothetical protein